MSAEVIPMQRPSLDVAETEAALIAAMLTVNACIEPVADLVEAKDFGGEFYGQVFELILNEHGQGKTVNVVTLRPFIGDEAARALVALTNGPGSGAAVIGARDFARQIAEAGRRRRLIESLQGVIASAEAWETPLDKLTADIDLAMSGIVDEAERGAKEATAAEAIGTVLKQIEAGLPPGVMSGIGGLDEAMGPLRPGDLQIIAARPSMGKTVLAASIAKGAASEGHGVLFVSLEMTEGQLAMRLAADLCFDGHSGINFSDIERGHLTAEQFGRVVRAKDKIRDMPLVIADLPSIRAGRLNTLIRRHARRFAAKGNRLELVIVDYLQLIDPDRQSDNRTAEVTQISRALKMMAKANGVAVVALAQLSRKVEEREEKRPRLSDLRESGSIEQDADGVLFLYRPEYYLQQSEPPEGHERREKWEANMDRCKGDIEFICAKRRQGQTGIRHGRFHGCFQAVR